LNFTRDAYQQVIVWRCRSRWRPWWWKWWWGRSRDIFFGILRAFALDYYYLNKIILID